MPATARFVSPNQRIELHDPANNLAVGQRYIGYLAGIDIVSGDLLRLLATYNSGPGGFVKWAGGIRDGGGVAGEERYWRFPRCGWWATRPQQDGDPLAERLDPYWDLSG